MMKRPKNREPASCRKSWKCTSPRIGASSGVSLPVRVVELRKYQPLTFFHQKKRGLQYGEGAHHSHHLSIKTFLAISRECAARQRNRGRR